MKSNRRRSKSKPTILKRGKRGYTRNLGRTPEGIQPKFYLGHDREQAVIREKRLVALWEHVEKYVGMPLKAKVWTPAYLAAAKAIAKGETPEIPAKPYEIADEYVVRINELKKEMGAEAISLNEAVYAWGVEQLERDIERANMMLARTPGSTGQTLHEALAAFQEYIEKEYVGPDGTITDNGKVKWRQVRTIKEYVPNLDLGELDFEGVDEIFGIFRRRPVSRRYDTPMTPKSCKNYIGELGRFFRWLHRQRRFQWRKPEDFDEIKRTPREFDEDIENQAAEVPVWTVKELAVINKYATPLERVFFLLGLNCAYGADQVGRLRAKHISQVNDEYVISRIRRKRKTRSIHLLWKQTEGGVLWAKDRLVPSTWKDLSKLEQIGVFTFGSLAEQTLTDLLPCSFGETTLKVCNELVSRFCLEHLNWFCPQFAQRFERSATALGLKPVKSLPSSS